MPCATHELIIVCAQNLTKISLCLITLMYEAHVLIHCKGNNRIYEFARDKRQYYY